MRPKLADFAAKLRTNEQKVHIFNFFYQKFYLLTVDLGGNSKFCREQFVLWFFKDCKKIAEIWPKIANFWPISKIFFSTPNYSPRHTFYYKWEILPQKVCGQQVQKTIYPYFGVEKTKNPISQPRVVWGQKIFGHKLGVGRRTKWAINGLDQKKSMGRIRLAGSWNNC